MSTEKAISEKELVFQMLEDYELDIVLKAFHESPKNKNVAFKRMKVKQHLNAVKSKSNRLTPFDFLEERLAYDELKPLSLEKMLRIFNNPEADIPNVVKYFTLRHYHPGFFKEHFEIIKENILNQRFFLTDIQVFQDEASLRDYYVKVFGFESDAREAYLSTLINWYEKHIGSLEASYELVKDWDLCAFDTKRRQLTEYNDTGLLLAMLKLKRFDETLDEIMIQHCIHDCLVERNVKAEDLFEERSEELRIAIEKLQQETRQQKKLLKQQEQDVKALKKAQADEVAQLNQEWQAKLEHLKQNHQKEVSLMGDRDILINEMEQQIIELEETVQLQRDLATNYKWALQSDYTALGLVVFHKSQMLYAKDIFPDIQFVTHVDQIAMDKPLKLMFIQRYGLPHAQRRQAQLFAQSQGIELKELDGREEREQIIVLSSYLASQPNTLK